MRSQNIALLIALGLSLSATAQPLLTKPADPYFDKFAPVEAPKPPTRFLKAGDRLAICGDSITEQKMYSRIMETYLTVCAPQLNISVRQFGWSGEKASGFLRRMTNDCLRFKPTVATTCYGMNDHEYRAYQDHIGETYRSNSAAIIDSFKAHGVRVILGSAGCVGKTPTWTGDRGASTLDLNLNLCALRNIDIKLAAKEKVGFADVFWPMLTSAYEARNKYGTNYAMSGRDGVHPGWAGHLVMAYAFLHEMGLDGEIGTFTADLRSQKARASKGHEIVAFKDGALEIKSTRYPFCLGSGDLEKDDNLLSGAQWVPFNQELNRMMLVVKHADAKSYQVTWGEQTKTYTGDELGKGVNLAADFPVNPFSDAFKTVDEAVNAKQKYETKQIKQIFHGAPGKADLAAAAEQTEQEREPLVTTVHAAFVPVTHTIKIVAQ